MKNNKEIEKLLLNDKEYEKILNSKIEAEFNKAISVNSEKKEIITNIKKVPKDKLFSKNTVYMVLNRANKTKSFINGIQAEGFLGTQSSRREKLIAGEVDYFISEDSYIKFVKWEG